MLQLTYSHTCTGKYSIYMCDQSSDLGAGYCHHHTDTIQHYSHTYTHAHSRMHSLTHTHTPRPQTLDWFRLIVPVSCLVLSQSKSLPGYTDNVYIVWLLDRAIVSFTLPPGLFSFSPTVTHFLFFFPFIFPLFLSTFRVASLSHFAAFPSSPAAILSWELYAVTVSTSKTKNLEGRVIWIQVCTSKQWILSLFLETLEVHPKSAFTPGPWRPFKV